MIQKQNAHVAVWREAERAGVSFAVLRLHGDREDTGATILSRFAADVAGGWHTHPGGEELFVIRGGGAMPPEWLGTQCGGLCLHASGRGPRAYCHRRHRGPGGVASAAGL